MTEGTSKGLMITVAVVIFGIFVAMADNIFGFGLTNSLVGLFTNATEQVDLGGTPNTGGGVIPVVDPNWEIDKDDSDVVVFEDPKLEKIVADVLESEIGKITYKELQSLESLTITNGVVINSLVGLEYAGNLKTVTITLEQLNSKNINLLGVLPTHTFVKMSDLDIDHVDEKANDAFDEQIVYIRDINLRILLREKLSIEAPTPITVGDLRKLKTLDITRRQIMHLTGLEYASNLEKLIAPYNYLNFAEAVIPLNKLNYVDLRYNFLSASKDDLGLSDVETVLMGDTDKGVN